jgi:hypothetical protein
MFESTPRWLLNILHIETLFILSMICIFIYFCFFYKDRKKGLKQFNELASQIVNQTNTYIPSRFISKKKRKLNQHEQRCRQIFESIFGSKFKSVRPSWLQNPVSGKNLELDGFNPYISTPIGKGLAFEYDGRQHSMYEPHFHRGGPDEFVYQTKKDAWKDFRCKEEGVLLIRIPHFVAYQDLERYIKQKLRNKGLGMYLGAKNQDLEDDEDSDEDF